LGLTYVQCDDVPLAMLCDPAIRDQVVKIGYDPDKLLDDYVNLFAKCFAQVPDDMITAVHLCRGNYKGRFLSEGGYEDIAEKLFTEIPANVFFLEYDTPRAGDFAPLRFVPEDKTVVLGIVSSKDPRMEAEDDLRRRIDEAAQHIDLDRLAISPQCGFASSVGGNPVTLDIERAKLDLVTRVADTVWD
ncbi:MAG: 5-methyltetrahydropteroyltriglutamate--homocysteine S-methyltransferase, partial [Alphaproteobacteria bacterium]|nr:5-methyltetrahydropteroyltriglutamate--homocysteine S-methyltransferase [Alphaproteobacteria bacterium]